MTDVSTMPVALLPRWIAGRMWLRVAVVVAGAGLMAAASRAAIPMAPVPLTLQTFALFVIAGLCGMRLAFEIVLVWILSAAIGLPALAGGAGGLSAVTGPTAGYLIGMLVAAPFAGRMAERTLALFTLIATFLVGHAMVLAAGWARLCLLEGWRTAFVDGVAPFVVGAIVKSLAAAAVVKLAAMAAHRAAQVKLPR
jgi:biotin transport system substrate-specific component